LEKEGGIFFNKLRKPLLLKMLCYRQYVQDIIGCFHAESVKYVNGLVVLDKEETVPQGMIDRLIEIRRFCGMEMNVHKTKVMRISRETSPVQIILD
jgi:hypothetical protein